MGDGERYWSVVGPVSSFIEVYDGPEAFLQSFQRVRKELGCLYAAQFCQDEVFNGGFHQFFCNSTGVLAPEAVEGFDAIGQPQIANLVRTAMALLGSPYQRERQSRQALLNSLSDTSRQKLEDLSSDFFWTDRDGEWRLLESG